jgi:hypothetical protein
MPHAIASAAPCAPPFAAQFQAAVGGEATLLALVYEIAAARPWGRAAAGGSYVSGIGPALVPVSQYRAHGIGAGGEA